jgi:hypothetical protein
LVITRLVVADETPHEMCRRGDPTFLAVLLYEPD